MIANPELPFMVSAKNLAVLSVLSLYCRCNVLGVTLRPEAFILISYGRPHRRRDVDEKGCAKEFCREFLSEAV